MTMTMEVQASSATRRDDSECQIDASAFLTDLLGSAPDDLRWDSIHHLQGHTHLAGHNLVVIASRDNSHHTIVLTLEDWDTIRRSDGADRRELLCKCAIESHARLLEVIAAS